jgi:RimJ/RimL family protein N-acetyltransferase
MVGAMLPFELASCRLRPWRQHDLQSLIRYANDRDVWINLRDRFPHPYIEADARRWLEYVCGEPVATQWAIEVDGEAAGGIGLEPQADIERMSAEIGFWLGRPFWGRGLMTQAASAVSEWALNQPGCLRLYASVLEWNPASMRVLEKAGYQREGLLRRSAIKDGVVVDRVLYARIRALGENLKA